MGTAIKTKGLGSRGNTAHLNLTRSLADIWCLEPEPAPPPPKPRAKKGRPRGPRERTHIPYAGSPPSHIRLKNEKGEWLHMSRAGTTLIKSDGWRGTQRQADALRKQGTTDGFHEVPA